MNGMQGILTITLAFVVGMNIGVHLANDPITAHEFE